jgi:Ca2+-binding RTX toxin-like protein
MSGTSDQITVEDYFLHSGYRIEQIQFADGTIWKATAINAWLASNNANVLTEGADTLIGTAANDAIAALGGNDTVSGSLGDDTLDGGAGDDNLFGNAGNDVLDGGAGTDNLAGGIGDDTYIVDSAIDIVIERPNEGTDTVYSSRIIT